MFFLLVLFCAFGTACAQMLPDERPASAPMVDSAGKPLKMDFNIQLTSIKDANMPYAVFSSRPLMIYYFGPHCPHCISGYGGVQQVAKEYEQRGLSSIAVSVGNASRRDLLMFMEQQRASIPFFQDAEQEFGRKYGDGYVPRLYLVSPEGQIFRYANSTGEGLKVVRADIEKMLGIK
ncbi:MAG: TlpA family protein disulfide reductase [Fibromonadaceae bacterium]|nr:TlpA family protein disulfide reductase [Fibromonadaceae bacterium]